MVLVLPLISMSDSCRKPGCRGVLVENRWHPMRMGAPAGGSGPTIRAGRHGGPNLRFNTVRAMKQHRESLGKLRVISLSQRFEPSTRLWLDDPTAGGILRNTGVHSFDLVRFLTGLEAQEALCFTQRVLTQRTEDGFGAVLKLAGGALGVVENNRATASRSGRIGLVGEKGQLCGDHVHGLLLEIQGASARSIPLPPMVPTVRECLAAFVSALHGRTPVPIPLEEGLRAVEIVDACRESAEMKMPRRVAGH